MNCVSFNVSDTELNNLQAFLAPYFVDNKNCDIYKFKSFTISIYHTKKVLIQGEDAQVFYEELIEQEVIANKHLFEEGIVSTTKSLSTNDEVVINQNEVPTIGCDEVGVGDFFGGLVAVACYVKPSNISYLKELGVKDSKKLTDEKMQAIFPELIKRVKYSAKYLTPSQYNIKYDQYKNSHVLKTLLHNSALVDLIDKFKIEEEYKVIMDEYCNAANYQKYLKQIHPDRTIAIDVFKTQAESSYIAVACASIIARIYFLNQIEMLNKDIASLNQKILLGNNENVFKLAQNIYDSDPKLLEKLVKKHFITYNKIVGE